MQYHAIPCNTMQYHGTLITADGAYHCPVGSIMAIFDSCDIVKATSASSAQPLSPSSFPASVVARKILQALPHMMPFLSWCLDGRALVIFSCPLWLPRYLLARTPAFLISSSQLIVFFAFSFLCCLFQGNSFLRLQSIWNISKKRQRFFVKF